ncbi:NAD(P)/FAD-dependent oxidoreductase [Saccharopolyspora sp. ASAGF58]|uniref:FAD-dependent oxidoreductase n=1 Tax=Saccharopolyspora sp. ASAGF58 TaxID=2719023 RepID=UPI0014402CE1|nr:NAD(P)/FAD-dependent oxidoreductase [Saccharopolyspora sp. ASAGF58]QIZ36453.1 FAD-dependent monooxygenase [Saccharopolyspora sp. ASAGF58]
MTGDKPLTPMYDVLICGAGAGGLTLAHLLGRQGRQVLLVDKQSAPRAVHKGELLQPRSVQLLDSVGLTDALALRGARRVRRLSCHTAEDEELVNLDFAMLDGPFNYGLLHFYKDFREVVGGQLTANVEYWQSTRAKGLLRDTERRVIGAHLQTADRTTDIHAALTVVCDGYGSRLRTAAGIDTPTTRYGHQLVAFDLVEVPELGEDMTMYLTSGGLRVLFQMPGNRARLYVQIPTNRFRELNRKQRGDWVTGLLREVPALDKVAAQIRAGIDDIQILSASRYNSSRWTVPGLVLLGDAAHGVHPMVGQGMNAAIGDAWSLAEQMSAMDSFAARDIDAMAGRYEMARRPVMDYVTRLSHTLAMLFTATSKGAQAVRPRLLRSNRDNVRLQKRIVYNMAGFGSEKFTAWALLSAFGLTRRVSLRG